METGRQRQPGRRSSEEERAGTEPEAKINQLGRERTHRRQDAKDNQVGEAQKRKELEWRLDAKDNQVGEARKRKGGAKINQLGEGAGTEAGTPTTCQLGEEK